MNPCGECSMCCKLLAIPELNKPVNVMCRFFRKGTGCSIHQQDNFPKDCHTYVCFYRHQQDNGMPLAAELRPDKCQVIIDVAIPSSITAETEPEIFYVRCHPDYPDAWKAQNVQQILAAIADIGATIYLVKLNSVRELHIVFRG